MDSSNEGGCNSVRLKGEPEPIALKSTTRTMEEKAEGTKNVDGDSVVEIDSTVLHSSGFEEKAMGISLILQCVVSKMNVPNLKSARLVSKTWKEEADKEIRFRDCFRLKFDPKTRPFNEGIKQLESSKDLPCFDFHLDIPDMEMKQVENFLSLFGSRVKSLTLKSLSLKSQINVNPLSTLLVGVPNLENLFLTGRFVNKGYYFKQTPKLQIKVDLTNLKHITFLTDNDGDTHTIEAGSKAAQIIDKAPNLLSINNAAFSTELLESNDASDWRGKIHLIKSFLFPYDYGENYANSGLQVENLSIKWVDYRSVGSQVSLGKLVKSSQNTLTTLVTFSAFICLPQETGFGPLFLPFQNLKVLQIRVDGRESFTDIWNNLCRNDFESEHLTQFKQEAFPNLTTVILELPPDRYFRESTRDLEYRPFVNAIESVVNLEIRVQEVEKSNYWEKDENRMRRIKELFPNVKHLKLKDSFKIPRILPFCFALWPELESLEFHVNFMRQRDMTSRSRFYFEAMKLYDNLDVVFTGLPLEMCKRLRKANPGESLEQNIQVAQDINSEERSKNSLVFLTELKKLTIVFSDIRPEISETECPISPVSCLYAFKLMPNLKVKILFDQNLAIFNPKKRKFEDQDKMEKYLEELAPHCEIGHWESGGVASLFYKPWWR